MYAPGQYRQGAKSRTELVGNSFKTRCELILFITSLHHSFEGLSVKYYRAIVKGKISIPHLFLYIFLGRKKYSTNNHLQQFGPPEKGMSLLSEQF